MNFTQNSKTKCLWTGQGFYLVMALSLVLLSFAKVGLAATNESVQHFKMLSTIEYADKGQFRNQAETQFTVTKKPLDGNKVQYSISPRDLSFVLDKKTRQLSGASKDLALLEKVNNQCVHSLKKVTRENIGKTWKQSFKLSLLDKPLLDELKFTLAAIKVETKVFGEMIAVRALSEPFVVTAPKKGGGRGPIKCKINTVYLFDPEIEDIYLSISIFEATTNINGYKEKLRHEVATYMTDASGESVDLTGLDKKFEKFVQKVGLAGKSLKIVDESLLPQWARSEGLNAAYVANICASTACEGALNPVVTVCMPAARTVAMQSFGTLTGGGFATAGGTVGSLGASVPAVGALNIAAAPAFMGVGVGTAAAIAGGTVGTVAVAGGGGGGGGAGGVTPASP